MFLSTLDINFGSEIHKDAFPKKFDKAYITKYQIKSFGLLINKKIHITDIIFTKLFLITVFLNSSIPWKNQLISIKFASTSKIRIL